MHGRLKVRTTEEEQARKKKEQALKVKAYRSAIGKIQTKRAKEELDDEMLTLTGQILLRNPDVSTLWNIRRECILKKIAMLKLEEKAAEQKAVRQEETAKNAVRLEETAVKAVRQEETEEKAASEGVVEAVAAEKELHITAQQNVFEADLSMTEQCLMLNPKSYGSWHHRCWILENCPKANWEREMQLCNKYLKLDERNFHTWDYRRYVVGKAGVPPQQELDFCTEKIKANFSNYSSWHNRSLLLPKLYPEQGGAARRPMSEKKLKEELEMVLTAAFTDPNDSSAWFYQRWLLGNSRSELDVCAFRINVNQTVLAFTSAIAASDFNVVVKGLQTVIELPSNLWKSVNQSQADTLWLADIATPLDINFETATAILEVTLNIPSITIKSIELKRNANSLFYFKPPNNDFAFSADVITELETQLESCNSLLEYEPDSKWTLLTSALLMRAIDSKKFHTKSLEYLQQLQKVDPLREGYYKDLASKWLLENIFQNWPLSEDFPSKLNLSNLDNLSSLYYTQYFCIANAIDLPEQLQTKRKVRSFTTLTL